MKRALSLLLTVSLIISSLSGCASKGDNSSVQPTDYSETASNTNLAESENQNEVHATASESISDDNISTGHDSDTDSSSIVDSAAFDWEEEIKFTGMSDESLQTYIKDSVYSQLIAELDSSTIS